MSASDTRTRVLFVSTNLDDGGAQRFTSNLANHLDRTAFRCAVCVLRPELGYPLRDDVAVDALGYRRRAWQIPSTVIRLRGLIRRQRPDVVLSNIAATNLITGAALWGSSDRPAWIARIGNDPSRHDGTLRRLLARRFYPRADRVVANSRGLAAAIPECYPRTRGNIEILATPTDFVEIDRMASESPPVARHGNAPVLVAVGRLYRQKRYEVMLRAVAEVHRRTAVTLWICGEGPEKSKLEALAERLGVGRSVRFLGFCRNPFSVMRQADCFVMTSEHEGLPNALIEAQGLGLPAVATDCPHGPSEIVVDGRTGYLVPTEDPEATARAILHVVLDETGRDTMRAEAKRNARDGFGLDAVVGSWQLLISEAGKTGSR